MPYQTPRQLSTLDKRFVNLVVQARITDRQRAIDVVREMDGRVRGIWLRTLGALDRDPSVARCYIGRRPCGCVAVVMREDELAPVDCARRLTEWRTANLTIELILASEARVAECWHQSGQTALYEPEK